MLLKEDLRREKERWKVGCWVKLFWAGYSFWLGVQTSGKEFQWGRWFYHSQVRQFGWGNNFFFFWINVTKHHKITMHCTFIHEPFLSFSANENISLHWNMNDNLKLISWIAHLQPFSLNLTFLLNLKAVREKFYCFDADILPSLHAWSHCCYHLGILHVQEGKNINVESPKLIWLSVC